MALMFEELPIKEIKKTETYVGGENNKSSEKCLHINYKEMQQELKSNFPIRDWK